MIVKTDGSFAALYETVPSFLPAKCGVGVGIPSVVQCPVCTVYSVQYCTVPVFLRTRLLTHTSAVSVGPTAVRFTPRCVIAYSYCYSEIKSW